MVHRVESCLTSLLCGGSVKTILNSNTFLQKCKHVQLKMHLKGSIHHVGSEIVWPAKVFGICQFIRYHFITMTTLFSQHFYLV